MEHNLLGATAQSGTGRGTGNGQGTATGKSGGGEEANRRGKKKGAHWWGAFKRTGGSMKEEVPIRFGTYNIRNGRNGGLESALWGMSQANVDLGISRRQSALMVSTTASRPDTASSLRTRRADTAAE